MQWPERTYGAPSAAEFPHLKKAVFGGGICGREDISAVVQANVTDDRNRKYIAEQNIDQDEDFKVDG